MAITPLARDSAGKVASFAKAPRSLNEPVTCRFSYLIKTSAPVRAESCGAGNKGVRRSEPETARRACSMAASVISTDSSCLDLGAATACVRSHSCTQHLTDCRGASFTLPAWFGLCASCVKLRLGPFLPAECIRRIGKRYAGERTEAGRRLFRSEAACLRPGDRPRAVRRRAGAARPGILHRCDPDRDPGAIRRAIHLCVRAGDVRPRLGAL